MYNIVLCEGRADNDCPSLCCEIQRETLSAVTSGFNEKFTALPEPVLLHLTGSNYHFRCLLPKI